MHRTIEHSTLVPLLGRPDPNIYEVGCNDGADTAKLLEHFPGAHIFCFEPDPRPRRRFLARGFDNSQVSLHAYAVGAEDGDTTFFQSNGDGKLQPADWDYSGSIHRPKEHLKRHPWCKFQTRIEVPVTQLDTFREDRGPEWIDFIWADVQGAEGDMIRGGPETLAHTHYLYTEFSDVQMYEGQITLDAILALLPGWQLVERFSEDVLLENTRWAR